MSFPDEASGIRFLAFCCFFPLIDVSMVRSSMTASLTALLSSFLKRIVNIAIFGSRLRAIAEGLIGFSPSTRLTGLCSLVPGMWKVAGVAWEGL